MSQEDLRAYVLLFEFVLQQDETLTVSIKLFLAQFENLQQAQNLRDQISKIEDRDDALIARRKLDEVVNANAMKLAPLHGRLTDSLAQRESLHEQLEHLLAKLKKTLET
jgi:hypothetical protein